MAETPGADYESISISVPRDLARALRGMGEDEVSAASVSALVTQSVAGRIDRDRRHRESGERLQAEFGLAPDQAALARQWADDVTHRRTTQQLPEYLASHHKSDAA